MQRRFTDQVIFSIILEHFYPLPEFSREMEATLLMRAHPQYGNYKEER